MTEKGDHNEVTEESTYYEDKECCEKFKSCCAESYHPYKKIPLLKWIQSYKLNFILPDMVAGLTIAFMLIPQCLAYSEVAGLDAKFGLYSGFLGLFTFSWLTTSKQCLIGPSSISAALMRDFIQIPAEWPFNPEWRGGTSSPYLSQMLAFMMGALLSFLGFAKLGFILNFVSGSVIAGFLQAQGLTVPLGQLKKLFGIHNDSDFFIQGIINICTEIFDGQVNWFDFAVGASTIILIVGISFLDRVKVKNAVLKKLIWFLMTAKNSIVIILMMVVAICTESQDQVENFLGGCITSPQLGNRFTGNETLNDHSNCTTLTLTKIKNVPVPTFQPPAFTGFDYPFCNPMNSSLGWTYESGSRYPEDFNLTMNDWGNFTCENICDDKEDCEKLDVWFVTYGDMIRCLGAGLVIQPIVSFLQTISLAKSFAKKPPQYQIDPTQEFISFGLANVANSFVFGIIPVTATMSRTTVMYLSAKTQLASWLTSAVILLTILFIADIFVYIPAACLAGVVIVAAASMFKPAEWKQYWDINRSDMIPFVVTFVFTLRKSSTGLIAGIFTHLVMCLGQYLLPINRPKSKGKTIYLDGILMFPCGDTLSAKMQRNGARLPVGHDFVVDFKRVISIDAGAGFGIVDGVVFTKEANRSLNMKLTNIEPDHLEILVKCGLPKYVGVNGNAPEKLFDCEEVGEKKYEVIDPTKSSVRKRTTVSSKSSIESL